jgi:hypothetical protein
MKETEWRVLEILCLRDGHESNKIQIIAMRKIKIVSITCLSLKKISLISVNNRTLIKLFHKTK